MSSSKFVEDQRNSFNEFGTSDELNYGLMTDEIFKDRYPAQPEAGANTILLGTSDNHAIFQPVNTPIYPNQWAQHEANPLQFGTVTNHAMNQGFGNVQLARQLDQPEGAIAMVNPCMSHRINLCRFAKPGSSQSSNISNTDIDKRLKKRECDRKSREKKEKMRKENEEKLAKFAAENKHLKEDNATLQDGLKNCQEEARRWKKKVGDLEKEVSRLNNKLERQNTRVETLEKLVASTEGTDLVAENKQLKRKIEQLKMTQLRNPDSMKIVEIQEEKEQWERKAKRLQVINDLLCDHKMNNDEK